MGVCRQKRKRFEDWETILIVEILGRLKKGVEYKQSGGVSVGASHDIDFQIINVMVVLGGRSRQSSILKIFCRLYVEISAISWRFSVRFFLGIFSKSKTPIRAALTVYECPQNCVYRS